MGTEGFLSPPEEVGSLRTPLLPSLNVMLSPHHQLHAILMKKPFLIQLENVKQKYLGSFVFLKKVITGTNSKLPKVLVTVIIAFLNRLNSLLAVFLKEIRTVKVTGLLEDTLFIHLVTALTGTRLAHSNT